MAAGAASILQSNPSSTLINQQSRNAIINWQNFSVGNGASVTFQQPDSGAITLNRVTGSSISAIDGSILANGQVWLLNRNGVLFGQGSHIDVGGLLATTSDIKDADFLSGNYAFGDASQNGQVVNQGSIKAATGGSVVLSATHVVNQGVIAAKLGHVMLGGAKAFSVDFDGDNLIRYQITAPVTETPKDQDGKPVTALVENSGTIAAQGGQVLMTARAARDVIDQVINTTGIIQANTVSVHNGEVVLDAGDGGAAVAGTVEASGQKDGETGGAISVRGEKIAIADGTKLDASGQAGGGTVSIGDQATSQSVTVGKAVITADAVKQGQGGSVAIISSGTTKVAASLSTKGIGGGGHVETSGSELDISDDARVDASASAGPAGLWLLDPTNVTISAASILSSIATTNVSVTASNDIIVDATLSYNSANSLSLLAGHNITVNRSVQNSGSGAIFAIAGWDGVTQASAVLTTPGAYGANGGSVLIGGAGALGGVALGSRAGTTTIAAQNLDLVAANGFAHLGYHGLPGASIATSGDITVQLSGGLTLVGSNLPATDRFAQIGHGGPDSAGTLSGNITVAAQNAVTLTGGAATRAYAQIGNGGALTTATIGGTVQVASGGNVSLNSGALITAGSAGDALVVAAAGNFVNQGTLQVSSGGRWLVFLAAPANSMPGGLSASPFYNRAFDFSAKSYAPLTGAGNRFVYALAPVLTVTANGQTRIYGSANPALTGTITGVLPGDGSAGVSGAASFSTNAVNNSGVGNYAITAGLGTLVSDYNYGFQFVGGTLRIDPALLTASLTGTIRKTYDGTTTAAPSAANYQLSGILFGDNVNVSGSAAYSDKNVGTGKTVTVGGLALSGTDAGNYLLASSTISANIGVIDPAALTASLTGTVRKTYDGTAVATLTPANYGLAGAVAGDSVTLNNPATGSYNDKNVGTAKTVTVGGLALSGTDSGNYLLAASTISANIGVIDPAALTATASLTGTARKTYDGSATASLTPSNYALAGIVPGDSVALNNPATGVYSDKNVGTAKTVTVSSLALSGVDAGNYLLTSSTIFANIGVIDPAILTASLTGTVRKTYDGNANATLADPNYGLAGAVSGDSVALNNPATGSYNDKNVGTGKTVTVGGVALFGADAGNYLLTSSTISANIGVIDPAVLTATATASLTGTVRKTYDGTATAILTPSNYALAGIAPGDLVALNNPATGIYSDKNVGSAKTVTVTGLALSGANAGNYLLASSTISANIGVIDPATLTVLLAGTVQKIFDGTTNAGLDASNYALTGAVAGDDVALNNPAQGAYDTKFVGIGKTITVGGLALSGADAGNYILSATSLSDVIGVILVNRAPDVLGNSFTSGGVQTGGPAAAPTGGGAPAVSDATADTGVGDQSDSASFALGKSLGGSSQSTSSVLIDGLLRQFTPAPGSNLPHGVPPFGQVYSSWGNEAFWQ